MSFFNYAIKKSEDDKRLREEQQKLQNNPFYTLTQSLYQNLPSAGLQIAGNLIGKQADYHKFGGKRREEHAMMTDFERLRSEDFARRFKAAQESPTQRALFESGQGGIQMPPHIQRLMGRRQTQRQAMPSQSRPVGQPAAQPAAGPVSQKQTATKAQQEEKRIPTYREVAEAQYPAETIEYTTPRQKRMNEVGRRERALRTDGREKLLKFNASMEKIFERFEDRGLLRTQEGRNKALRNIVDRFTKQVGTLPEQERQNAYNNMLSRAGIAFGVGDVSEMERKILESPNGGRVRQYSISGKKSLTVNYRQRQETEKAYKAATIEREKHATNIRAIDAALEKNDEAASKESDPEKLNALIQQRNQLLAEKESESSKYQVANLQVQSALGAGNKAKQRLTVRGFVNPITGEVVPGSTFSGVGGDQPGVTRQENIRVQVLESVNNSPAKLKVGLRNVLYANPEAYLRIVSSPDPNTALAEYAAGEGNSDLLKKPSSSEQKRRNEQDRSIVNNMQDSETFNQVTSRFPKSAEKSGMQKLLSGDDMTDYELSEVATLGRLAGVKGSIIDQRYNRIAKAHAFVTPNNYNLFTNDFKKYLDENKGMSFNNSLETAKESYKVATNREALK